MKNSLPLFVTLILILISPVISTAQKTFIFGQDSTKSVIAKNLIKTSENTFIISGSGYNYDQAIESYPDYHFVVNFDLNGDTLWTRLYDLDWYADGNIIETDNNYQIFFNGDGSFVCDGLGLSYPFSSIKTRIIDFEGNEQTVESEYNPKCSNSIIHHQSFQNKNYFLSQHSNLQEPEGYLALTQIDADGSKNFISLNIKDDNRFGSFITDTTIYIIGPKSIYHLNHQGEIQKSFEFDNIRYEKTVRVFTSQNNDSLIVFYCNYNSSSRKAVVRTMDKEGKFSKETIIPGFRFYDVIMSSDGNYLLAGQNSQNDMTVVVLNNKTDSINSIVYKQNKESYGVDILDLNDGNFMLAGRLGGFGDKSQYIVVIDTVSLILNIANHKSQDIYSAKVYPNPTNGIFKLKLDSRTLPINLKIFDATGREVFSNPFQLNTDLDLSHLENGTYSLSILDNDKWVSKRLIIKK